MNNDVQYEIYIGCGDQQTKEEIVSTEELGEIVDEYFQKKKINYSMQHVGGGYLHENGKFVIENTLCIILVGKQNFDIVKFAKGLSMYMNQECLMITKNDLLSEFR